MLSYTIPEALFDQKRQSYFNYAIQFTMEFILIQLTPICKVLAALFLSCQRLMNMPSSNNKIASRIVKDKVLLSYKSTFVLQKSLNILTFIIIYKLPRL